MKEARPSLIIRGARQLLTLRGAAEPRLGLRMKDVGLIADGSILIQNGCIAETGSSRRVANLAAVREARESGIEELDASGCIVLPGLVDPITDLLGARPSLPAIARRALRLLEHGTTTTATVTRQRKPLRCEQALSKIGLDVAWDVPLQGEVFTPLRRFCSRMPPEPMRDAADSGRLVALASDFRDPDSPACSMIATISLACLAGDLEIEEAITAATTNAAHLIGKGALAGSLDLGRPADLLILDVTDYTTIPYHFGENLIRAVIKGGKLAYQSERALPVL